MDGLAEPLLRNTAVVSHRVCNNVSLCPSGKDEQLSFQGPLLHLRRSRPSVNQRTDQLLGGAFGKAGLPYQNERGQFGIKCIPAFFDAFATRQLELEAASVKVDRVYKESVSEIPLRVGFRPFGAECSKTAKHAR